MHSTGHLPMSNIKETQLNPSDAKAVFKTAVNMRDNPGLVRRMTGLSKDKIDINDLQKAWADDGYPDDLRDIERILKDHGFGKGEINKVFSKVFSKTNGKVNYPTSSPAIQKIANYAKQHGIDKEIIAFLEREYNIKESHEFEGKALIEDVREIFTYIALEDRTTRLNLIKEQDRTHLGRTKK